MEMDEAFLLELTEKLVDIAFRGAAGGVVGEAEALDQVVAAGADPADVARRAKRRNRR